MTVSDFVLAAIGADMGARLEPLPVDVHPIPATASAFGDALEALRGRGGVVLTGRAHLSSAFTGFVAEALSVMKRHPEVAFASLGAYRLRPLDRLPFTTLLDGSDGIYLRAAPLFGVVLGPAQVETALRAGEGAAYPCSAMSQGEGRGLFPRAPVAVGVPATEFCSHNIDRGERQWSFVDPEASLARYDRWFEPEPEVLFELSPALAEAVGSRPLVVDLYGVRPLAPMDGLVLTTRRCRNPVMAFGLELQPIEANVAAGVRGEVIRLAHRSDVHPESRPFRGYLRRHVGHATDIQAYLLSLLPGVGG
jgi:hypothetical protein